MPNMGNMGNINIPDMNTPDLSGMSTPDLSGMSTPDPGATPEPEPNNGGGNVPDLNNLGMTKAFFCAQVQTVETNSAMLDLLINGYKGMGKLSSCDGESSK